MITIHIHARDGRDFHRQIAIFGYSAYIGHQRGAVLIMEDGFRKRANGGIEATVTYVALKSAVLPQEVVPTVKEYDPERACVFGIVDGTGKATCIMLSASRTGATPKHLFEQAITAQQHVPILPGTIVRVTDCTVGIDPGLYVFLGEDKSEMALSVVGGDRDGNIVATDDIHRVHVDYGDALEVTSIRIGLVGGR